MSCMLRVQAGVGDLHFDVDGSWTLGTQATAAGAAVIAAWWYLWPAAAAHKARRARAGLVLGISVVAAAWLLQGLLCVATPYCL